MSFSYRYSKKPLKSALVFFIFLSCLSCQSLDQTKKAPKTRFRSGGKAMVIDQSYFNIQADSAYLKGEEAFYKGNNPTALRHFKTALLFAPHSLHLQKRIANIYEQEGLLAEAVNYYKILSQKIKKNKEFHQKLSSIYVLNDLNEKALELQKYLVQREPDNFSLWFKYALLLIHQEDWNLALRALQKAEEQALGVEEIVQSVLSQAYVWANLQNIPVSLKTMNKLARLPVYEPQVVLKIADFYKSLGQNQTALSYLEHFQKTQGVTKPVSQALLDYHISQENWEKAAQQIQQLLDLGQLENYHYFYMALLLMEKQNYDQALVFLKDLTAKNPQNGQYLYMLAGVYEQKKDWIRALKTYNQVHLSSPHFLAARLQFAQLLGRLGLKKRSFSILKKLSFPDKGDISPQALLLYAESLWRAGEKTTAISALSKGLKNHPFHADLLFLRGFYLSQSGKEEQALKDMQKILTKQENHEEALNFIADFYSKRKINLNKAERLARKALSLKPHSSYFSNTLGWILFQKGNLKSALYYLNQAFEQNKTDSLAKRLGTVYLQLKDFEKSRYFFKEALRLEQNGKKAVQSKDKTLLSKQALAK